MKKNRFLAEGMTVAAIIALLLTLSACPTTVDGGTGPLSGTFTVTFNADDGTPQPADQRIAGGNKVTEPSGVTKAGYTLEGWYKEAVFTTRWDFAADTVTADIILYAKWTENAPGTFTVTFNVNGGTPQPADQNIADGGTATEPSGVTKAGYTLEGWYKEEAFTTRWNFAADTVTTNIILYARWTENAPGTFTVTFNVNGGTPQPADQNIASGGMAAEPTGVTKAGFILGGWYRDAECRKRWNFATDTVTANITLYAKWGIYAVTFNSNGGSTVASQGFNSGDKAAWAYSTKAGYTIEGWYKEAACINRWNFATELEPGNITLYANWENESGRLMTRTVGGKTINFRYVPSGSFQRDGKAEENVSIITNGYWLGETEVSQELFEAVMGTNPSYFSGSPAEGETQAKRPVEQVNWYAAIAFCNKLSLLDGKEPVYSVDGVTDWAGLAYGDIPASDNSNKIADWKKATQDLTKNGYRLPTEMEWMWAAMGADKTAQPNTTGRNKAFAGSDGNNSIEDYAWHTTNSGGKTHEAGRKTANELNLFDMSGNVWEWCWDWYGGSAGSSGTISIGKDESHEKADYTGPATGTYRVVRGGSWNDIAASCAAAYRSNYALLRSGNFGFRVLCPQ